jgi:type I restriction enzyme S subunit
MSTSRQWPIKRIGELANVARGSSPRPIADQRYFEGGDIPWIKIADATKSGKYLYKTKEHVNEFGASFSRRLAIGSLIVAASGTLGYTQMLGVSGCVHDGWLYLTDFRGVDKHYLYYFFQWKKEHFYNSAYGAAIQNINTEILRETEIALPPLPVQERIASILSAYDDLIENNTRRIKILEEMAQMLYREWFVNFRFPGHESVRMIESELGPIPEGWQTGILRDVCDSMDYGYTASATAEPIGPKFLRITDIVPSAIDWHTVPHCPPPERNADKYALCEGDIVVARTGATTGYAKRLHKRHPASIFASYLVRLRIKPSFSNHLFGVLVESDEYKRFIKANWSGAAQPQANAQVLTSIPILISPEPLQRQFSAMTEPLLDLKEALQFKNRNLRNTRDLLLPKLIAGEIPVDTADQAAPELVEQPA